MSSASPIVDPVLNTGDIRLLPSVKVPDGPNSAADLGLGLPREGGEGVEQGAGVSRPKPLHREQSNSKLLLCS